MKTNEPFIMSTDAAAATYRTDIKGWVSRLGRYFGDGSHGERMARYDGCTHRPCEDCEVAIPKIGWTVCDACREKRDIERYAKRERKPWDGKALLYSEEADKWFDDLEEIIEDCGDDDATFESLLLLIGKPVYARTIDPVDHYVDDLSEDADEGDLPAELQEAFEALNKVIEGCKTPLSWQPSKYALDLECFQGEA